MSSDAEVPEIAAFFERLLSRNRDLSLFIPFMLGLATAPTRDGGDSNSDAASSGPVDRIVFVNPFTQSTVMIEGASGDWLLASQSNGGGGQPPASKASIEAMPTVEIGGEGGIEGECVICLEEWKVGEVVKEMPCKHRFHGGCVEKWLGIHGSCPVCRHQMPAEEKDSLKKMESDRQQQEGQEGEEGAGGEERRERRRTPREIWVSFTIGARTTGSGDSTDSATNSGSV
ncbi:unnamed protein product [Linum tenue]|uniref:RING-type E3 ubiquitin transferase n=1 Tax=Linum tenue TaxID=586396 RepID=A0AAV0MR33_9ROSI|nr:unnamed protein product [Linum tenue]